MLCGGTGAVGTAIARELAAQSRLLIQVASSGVHPAEEIRRALGSSAESASVLGEDPSWPDGPERLLARARGIVGEIDALVLHPMAFVPTEVEGAGNDAERMATARLKAAFFLAKHGGLVMAGAGRGCLITVVDGRDTQVDGAAAWRIARAGLITMTEGLAKALPATVRVSAVVSQREEERSESQGSEAAARPCPPEDVARVVRFLLTEGPRTTGTIFHL